MQRVLWPMGVIQDPIFAVLNLILPQDGFEPATMSLPSWARVAIWLSALGIAYCIVAVMAYGLLALRESRQKRLAS